MLLTLSVILMFIAVNNKLNDQADMIIQIVKAQESFTTPNAAWNDAASFTTTPNYLLPKATQVKYMTEAPAYLPGRNDTRSNLAMNRIAPSNDQYSLPDANDINGVRNTVGFPGPINPTSIKGNVNVEGAKIKTDKVVWADNAPDTVQKNHVAEVEVGAEDLLPEFSPNSRVNASEALQFATPSAEMAKESLRRGVKNHRHTTV